MFPASALQFSPRTSAPSKSLLYGADDFDLPIEDEVTQKAGATISLNFDKLLATARAHGFTPTYRHVAPSAFR